MGSTPNFTLPYPELTDPADVPADIKRLADRLDAVLAAPQQFARIQNITLASAAPTIDFSSIPQTYGALLLILALRGDNAAAAVAVFARFNNDSTAGNYSWQTMAASGGGPSVSEGISQNWGRIGRMPGATAPTWCYSSTRAEIPNYTAGAGFRKTVVAQSASVEGNAGAILAEMNTAGWVTGTPAAINRITLLPATGNFVSGSRATLYGLAG